VAAAAVAATVLGTPAHATGNRMLHATVGSQGMPDAFVISLTDSAGQPVSRLGAGNYDIQIDDWASLHNFHLAHGTTDVFFTDIVGTQHSTSTYSLTTGSYTFRCDVHASMSGSFTVVSALAPDGSGTLTPSPTVVSAGSGKKLVFTYTVAAGGLGGGAVTLTAPPGWSAPSTSSAAPGYTTSTAGSVSVSGQKITVTGLNLASGTFKITYGAGSGATTSGSGVQTWAAQERSSSDGTLTNLASQPHVRVLAPDGSGSLSPASAVISAGTGKTMAFTYTAAGGGTSGGSLTLEVPNGWSTPSTTPTAAGFVTASSGTVSVASRIIKVSALNLNGGDTVTLTYGDKSQGGPGAAAIPSAGPQTWSAKEASTSGGTLTALASSPKIRVASADGSGKLSTQRTVVSALQTGTTTAFTYTAAPGGTVLGTVKLVVPNGWSAPSTAPLTAGYTTSSSGTLTISSRTIFVTGVTLSSGAQLTITYGARTGGGPGATAPGVVGTETWTAGERSTTSGTLTALPSLHITVLAHDGSGTMKALPTSVVHSTQHHTLAFTYTAVAGGTSKGTVTLVVPPGWSPPSLTSTAPGYVRTSQGTLSVTNRSIAVGGLDLAAASHFTITYGVKTAGGPGATAPTATGAQEWATRERSWPGGVLRLLASSPSITVT
jgi:hypothetical protein